MTHDQPLTRRSLLAHAALGGGLVAMGASSDNPALADESLKEKTTAPHCPFRFSLNMATISGQKLSLPDQIEVAAKAGYDAIEPWVADIHHYREGGGRLKDIKKRIADHGLAVPSAIGFADWIDDDAAKRAAGLEQWKRDAAGVADIGGIRLAAPPGGAYNRALDLRVVADRYRQLIELSAPLGIVPELEMWGGSKTLSRMSEIAYVLVETAHTQACGLLDVFHIFKGGSDFTGVRVFNGTVLHVLHMNDYPKRPREMATDADRVYPGDGAAPIVPLLRNLKAIGYTGALSIEIFNREYWKQDALAVARQGRLKMQAVVDKALA